MNINSLMFSDAVFTHTHKKVVFAEQKISVAELMQLGFFLNAKVLFYIQVDIHDTYIWKML